METHYSQEPATPEEIWKILREVSDIHREISDNHRELSEKDKETKQNIDRLTANIDQMSKEADQRAKEADKREKEANKRMRELEDLFTGQWGKLMESLVEGDLVKLLRAQGIEVQHTCTHVKGQRNGEHYEYDILAVNGEDAVVVEVKTTLRADDVKHFLEKLSKFTTWVRQYREHRILGAMAYLKAVQDSEVYAERQGLYVIRATGSSARIINGEGFQPRTFG